MSAFYLLVARLLSEQVVPVIGSVGTLQRQGPERTIRADTGADIDGIC